MVDRGGGAEPAGEVELVLGGRHGGHDGAEVHAQLHRGGAHAAAGTQHHELVPGPEPGHRTQHVVGGAIGDAGGGRGGGVHAVGSGTDHAGGEHRLLGEGTHQAGADHGVSGGEAVHAGSHLQDGAGQLAARDERRLHPELVRAGREEHVGEVDRRHLHSDAHIAVAERRARHLPDPDHLGWAELGADRGSHER